MHTALFVFIFLVFYNEIIKNAYADTFILCQNYE